MTVQTNELGGLECRLFGTFDVRLKGLSLPPLRYRKEKWLLALLILRQERDVPRDWLAGTLWPDNEESLGRFYLRKALSNLRKALGDEASRLQSPTSLMLRLNMSGAFSDVLAFDAAVSGREAAGEEERLQEAVGLYRGPLLQDCQEEWAFTERNAREQSYLAALERLAAIHKERGEPAASVRWLRQLVAADPYRESAHCALMQALADSGDRAAMQQVYREMRLLLRRDLNADPCSETETLYRSLGARSARPVVSPPAPPPPSGPPRRLPVPLSDLIGREREVEEVCGWLGKSRLVTLAGAGGVGKTRLSIAAAERAIGQFAEGVWFADLAPLNDPAQITPTLLRLFGLQEDLQSPPENSLERALRSHTLLLILDNCEHLLEACAVLAHRLLSACPGLRVLATSREALGLTGEHIYRVPSLSLPPAGQAGVEKEASSLLEYVAVRLFVERARQAGASFQLTRSNAGAVVQICHRLDGIPLALELAAARVKALSLAQIAARLDDRFHLLTGGSRAALPRQRTLQMAIDWSHDLLSEGERTLFRRLSVFAGGWSLEAAEAVCAGGVIAQETALDALTHLVEKSLAAFDEPAEGTARYRLLESMRQYGVERLAESGETEALRNRHRDFFLQWAEEAEPHFYGPEQGRWYVYVEKEYDNLRAALEWCQRKEASEEALRLVGALSAFWDVRGRHKEGLAHQIAALSLTGAVGRAGARAKALLAAGQLSARQLDFALATTLLEECLTLQRELGNRRGVGRALNELADVAFRQGDHRLAHTRCKESLTIAQELGDRPSAVGALNMLGQLALHEGDYPLARSFYEECLAIDRELGDTRGIAGSLRGLGNVAYERNDPALARSLYEESLAIDRELGDRWGIIYTLGRLGRLARAEGDYGRASSRYKERLALCWELGEVFAIISSLEDFASMAVRQGQELPAADSIGWSERAARLLGAAEALCQTMGRNPPATDMEEYVRAVDISRAALGEASFAAARAKGRAMTMEQSIKYALAW